MVKIKKPCLDWETDNRVCPEPGNCFKCLISKADCSYWWMVSTKKHRHHYKTIVIDSRGWKHQKCKCGEHRVIEVKV